MKLTKNQLKAMIKEELEAVLEEEPPAKTERSWGGGGDSSRRGVSELVQWRDGSEEWVDVVTGERSRRDGPAFTNSEGDQHWYQYDELHREDGPAIVYADDPDGGAYFLWGQPYPEEKYWNLINKHKAKNQRPRRSRARHVGPSWYYDR